MANDLWKGSVGNWSIGTNWKNGEPTHKVAELNKGQANITSTVASKGLLIDSTGTVNFTSSGNLATGAATNAGFLFVDTKAGEGGSVEVMHAFDNTGTLVIGSSDNSLSAKTRVAATSISNSGTIAINGGTVAADSATLSTGAPAGLGTVGEITGNVHLSGFSELVFGSGEINTIGNGGTLSINGPHAFVADHTKNGKFTSNTALTGLSTIDGTFKLAGGASVSTNQALTNAGLLLLDGGLVNAQTHLTVGGNLTNNSGAVLGVGDETFDPLVANFVLPTTGFDTLTINGSLINQGDVQLGSPQLKGAVVVTASGVENTGTISLFSRPATSSSVTLDVAAVAGFGIGGSVTGDVYLTGNSTIEFRAAKSRPSRIMPTSASRAPTPSSRTPPHLAPTAR